MLTLLGGDTKRIRYLPVSLEAEKCFITVIFFHGSPTSRMFEGIYFQNEPICWCGIRIRSLKKCQQFWCWVTTKQVCIVKTAVSVRAIWMGPLQRRVAFTFSAFAIRSRGKDSLICVVWNVSVKCLPCLACAKLGLDEIIGSFPANPGGELSIHLSIHPSVRRFLAAPPHALPVFADGITASGQTVGARGQHGPTTGAAGRSPSFQLGELIKAVWLVSLKML